jgi:hypothetical protein
MELTQKSWKAIAVSKECIDIIIDEDIDLSDLGLTILNENRLPIFKLKLTAHTTSFCLPSGKPMFAQIANFVKYVEGSGHSYYCQIP